MNFARLNHILIPATRDERERLRRRSGLLKIFRPIIWLYSALSEEGRVLSVLLLFVGTGSVEVGNTQVYILFAALTGLLVGALGLRRAFALKGLRCEVKAPERVSIGQPMTITVSLHNRSDAPYNALRIRGPFLPWDGEWLSKMPRLSHLRAGQLKRLDVRVRFVHRGYHHLDPFDVGGLVPLGLSVGPMCSTGGCRFVVVPHIARVVSLRLPMGRSYQPGGVANASSTGEAMEMLGVRPYRRGDPVRDLHARTWARTGKPHVREYQQEYFTRIGVVVDNDPKGGTEEGFEAALSLAAGVVAKLTGGEALIDLLVLGHELHSFTIGRALGSLDQALDLLACAETGEPLDAARLLNRLEPYLARLSCIVLITQSSDESRLELAAAIRQRNVACRVLRIHDDVGSVLLSRRRLLVEARGRDEQVINASLIEAKEALVL